jgi:tight adherence protein C
VVLLLPALAFMFVSVLVVGTALVLHARMPIAVERRLGEIAARHHLYGSTASASRRMMVRRTLKKIGEAAPKSPAEMTKLQCRLVSAGFRSPEALPIFAGLRIATSVGVFLLFATPIIMPANVLLALGAAALGYVIPPVVLGRIAARRQHRVRLSLPDALDLLVVSVEAGLGLDQAVQRVGEELGFAHPDISDELRLINLELRAGKERSEALRNLAERTAVDDVAALVAILVQTDKFGTSVAQSLRVHSDVLRTKRKQRAEEAAAKTGAKMVFPLVFCIFPSVYVVTLGPAALKIIQLFIKMAPK